MPPQSHRRAAVAAASISGRCACAGSRSRRQPHSVRSRQSPGPPSGPQPARTRRSTPLSSAIASIVLNNVRVLAAPFILLAARFDRGRVSRVAGDTIVATILIGNAIAVGLALGRWRGALIPYVPQLPVEYLAAATAADRVARRPPSQYCPVRAVDRSDECRGDARVDGRRGGDRGAPHPPRPMTRRRRRSLLYVVYLHSPLWRLRRRIWILRAGGRCQRCGSRRRLTIHHRTYQRLGHERRADVTVLCWRLPPPPPQPTPAVPLAPPTPGSDPRTTLVMATRLAARRPRLAQPSRTAGTDRAADADRRRHAARKAMRRSPIPSRSPVGASGVDRLVALRADCAPAAARVASRSLRSLPLALRASVPLGRQAGAAGPRSTNRSPQGGNT